MLIEQIIRDALVPNWRMPYAENFFKPHTDMLPSFAGFHRNLGTRDDNLFHAGFTLRFLDGFYCMVPSIRTKGSVPYDKHGRIKLRCQHRGCKAKSLVRCLDETLIETLNYNTLRSDPDLWHVVPNCGIPHTCNQKVPFYFSDKRNFGEDYRDKQIEYNDGTAVPWEMTCKDWTSGLGNEFDAVITGTKLDHGRKVATDRAKELPSNKHALTPLDLIVPKKCKFVETTILGENNFPLKVEREFYRTTDMFGNMLFLTAEDAHSLYKHDSWFCDATYSPISGSTLFVQLFIISVRIEIKDKVIMAFPAAWVLMVGKSHQQYDELFKTIKKIVKADIDANNGTQVSPLFIYADAELAIRSAAQNQFPSADHRICMFHVLQAWRRNLLSLNPGMKVRLQSSLDSDLEIRTFWYFVSGIPNINLFNNEIRSKTVTEMEISKIS